MQSHAGRQAQFSELDTALAAIGVGRSHALLLICIALLWAGDAAEVMALSYLSPAVSSNIVGDKVKGRGGCALSRCRS